MENLFEQSKKFFIKTVGVFSFIAGIFVYFTNNSKFLWPCVQMAATTILNQYVLRVGFATLGVFSFIVAGVIRREQNYLSLKSKIKEPRTFYEEKKFNEKLAKATKKRETASLYAKIFGFIAVICFLFVLCCGEIHYVISELTKPEIDRVVADKNYRIFMDLFTYICFDLAVVGYVISIPLIVRNRKFNTVFIGVSMVCDIAAIIHFTYFFMGNFTNYPSIEDGSIALTCLFFAILNSLYFKTENKKKTLDNFGGNYGII